MAVNDIAPGRLADPDGRSLFLREFIRNPARTEAFAPSSRHLAAAMIQPIPQQGDPIVVELERVWRNQPDTLCLC